jgi:formate dehydrogenase subunit gamma
MHGALKAMKTGYVDEAWASEHHELWLDDVKQGKIPAQRSGRPAPASVSPASVSPARPATSA